MYGELNTMQRGATATLRAVKTEANSHTGTQTIDLNSLFDADALTTGCFDLRAIEYTSLGMLLDALPLPALLIDRWYHIAYCNHAGEHINPGHASPVGGSFLSFLPPTPDAAQAEIREARASAVLERVFESRKPHQFDAILEIAHKKMWCRLHVRSVKLAAHRHLLVLIQDITHERIRHRLNQREERRLRGSLEALQKQVELMTRELRAVRDDLIQEREQYKRQIQILQTESLRFETLAEHVPCAVAVVDGSDDSVAYANGRFRELLGVDCDLSADFQKALTGMCADPFDGPELTKKWLHAISKAKPGRPVSVRLALRSKGDVEHNVVLEAVKLSGGDYFVTCTLDTLRDADAEA